MPTVPLFKGQQETLRAIPGARINPNKAGEEAFGGGASAAKTTAATDATLDSAAKMLILLKQQANETLAQDLDFELGKSENDIRAKIGALQGADAIDSRGVAETDYWEAFEAINERTDNGAVKSDLLTKARARFLVLDKYAATHANQQSKIHQVDSFNSIVSMENIAVADNPTDQDRVDMAMKVQAKALFNKAVAFGYSQEQINNEWNDMVNATNVSRINSLIESDPTMALEAIDAIGPRVMDADQKKSLRDTATLAQKRSSEAAENIFNEAKDRTVVEAGDLFVQGKLSLQTIDNNVATKMFTPIEAGIFKYALFGRKKEFEAVFGKEKGKSSKISQKGAYFVRTVKDVKNELNKAGIVMNAIGSYNDETINATDLAWVLRIANEVKDKKQINWVRSEILNAEKSGAEAVNSFVAGLAANAEAKMKYSDANPIIRNGRLYKYLHTTEDGRVAIELA